MLLFSPSATKSAPASISSPTARSNFRRQRSVETSFSFLQIDLLRNTGSLFLNVWFGVERRHGIWSRRRPCSQVSSYVRLDLPTARPPNRSFHLVFESHDGPACVPSP